MRRIVAYRGISQRSTGDRGISSFLSPGRRRVARYPNASGGFLLTCPRRPATPATTLSSAVSLGRGLTIDRVARVRPPDRQGCRAIDDYLQLRRALERQPIDQHLAVRRAGTLADARHPDADQASSPNCSRLPPSSTASPSAQAGLGWPYRLSDRLTRLRPSCLARYSALSASIINWRSS